MFRSPWEVEQLNREHIEDLLIGGAPHAVTSTDLGSRAMTAVRHGLGRAFIAVGERLAERDAAPALPPGVNTAFTTHW